MSCHCERKKRPRFPVGMIFGLALIGLGLAFILHNLYIIHIEDALRFWPIFLIAWGISRLWNKGPLNVWGHTLVVTGIALQIGFWDYWRGRTFEIWWPTIYIWIGLVVLIKAFVPEKAQNRAIAPPSGREAPAASNDDGEWPGWEDGPDACGAEGDAGGETDVEIYGPDAYRGLPVNVETENGEGRHE